jgi:hypothetical protein
MHQRRLIFTPESLVSLLTHYTDGLVPLDSVVREVMTHAMFQRMVGLVVDSAQWSDIHPNPSNPTEPEPLNIRYEGKKTLSWGKRTDDHTWTESIEGPKRT